MSTGVDIVKEFRSDNRYWWLRWADGYELPANTGVGASAIHVVLSPLRIQQRTDIPSINLECVKEIQDDRCKRVSAGMLPALCLGAVYHQGKRVGTLPLVERSFKVTPLPGSFQVVKACDKLSYSDRSRVIEQSEYFLGSYQQSKCVVVYGSRETLIIPCHEIFRSLYAPDGRIAKALTSGHWAQTKSLIIDQHATTCLPNFDWRVVLRNGIDEKLAPAIGNLVLSPAGRRGAAQIYSYLFAALDKVACSRDLSKKPIYSALHCEMPFDLNELEITARGLVLGPSNRFLVMEILEFSWPSSTIKIHVAYEDRHRARKLIREYPSNTTKPKHKRKSKPNQLPGHPVLINNQSNPDRDAGAEHFRYEGPKLQNQPAVIRQEQPIKIISKSGLVGDPALKDLPLPEASPNPPRGKGKGQRRADYHLRQLDEEPENFRQLVQLLAELQEGGLLQEWTLVPSPEGALLGGWLGWRFSPLVFQVDNSESRLDWSFISAREERLRRALICKLTLKDNDPVFWLEVETRPNENYRSLLFQVVPDQLQTTIQKIMTHAVQEHGVWRDLPALKQTVGAVRLLCWTHQFRREKKARQSDIGVEELARVKSNMQTADKKQGRKLNSDSAWKAVCTLLLADSALEERPGLLAVSK